VADTIGETYARAVNRRPNILLILTDEERYRVPRPSDFSLPGRERLAARGTSFQNFYVTTGMCSPSRSVIYTGQHLPLTEMYDNTNFPFVHDLDPNLGTMGTLLREAGYYCSYQGKWHLSDVVVDPANPASTSHALERYGFSDWNDWGDIDGGAWAGLSFDPVIAGQAARWLRTRAAAISNDQPWFLAVNLVNPHDIMSFDFGGRPQLRLPPALAHAFVTRPAAAVPVYQREWDFDLPPTLHEDLRGAPPAVREYADAIDTLFGPVTDDARWRAATNFYLNCLRDVDRHVEIVLDALEACGAGAHTVVVFTSDHGDMLGSHGLRQKANLLYDENLHVPFIFSHPDLPRGTETAALASTVDLVPTLLACAGLSDDAIRDRHPSLHGHSLLPACEGTPVREGVLAAAETASTIDGSFWHHLASPDAMAKVLSGELRPDWRKRGFLRGYLDQRYTFGRYFAPIDINRPADVDDLFEHNDVVLYDRATDPTETTNLAYLPEQRDLVARYREKLESLISAEIGNDSRAWVAERPQLLGVPTWRGDILAAA
jgi:arylsulfatase A-like enzyme